MFSQYSHLNALFHWTIRRLIDAVFNLILCYFFQILRTITLLYCPIVCIGDLAGLILLTSNMDEFLESIFFLLCTVVYTVAVYNLYFKRKQFIIVLDSLKEMLYSNIENKSICQMILDYSKKVTLIIVFLWTSACFSAFFHIFNQVWLRNTKKFLIFNTWYPYDRNENPYCVISYIIELFRLFSILNIVIVTDCVFILMVFYTIGQFSILSEKFENIFEEARENIRQNDSKDITGSSEENLKYNELLAREVNGLMKSHIEQHNALLK